MKKTFLLILAAVIIAGVISAVVAGLSWLGAEFLGLPMLQWREIVIVGGAAALAGVLGPITAAAIGCRFSRRK